MKPRRGAGRRIGGNAAGGQTHGQRIGCQRTRRTIGANAAVRRAAGAYAAYALLARGPCGAGVLASEAGDGAAHPTAGPHRLRRRWRRTRLVVHSRNRVHAHARLIRARRDRLNRMLRWGRTADRPDSPDPGRWPAARSTAPPRRPIRRRVRKRPDVSQGGYSQRVVSRIHAKKSLRPLPRSDLPSPCGLGDGRERRRAFDKPGRGGGVYRRLTRVATAL